MICGDVRKLDIDSLGEIDALAFGFPCNDFSVVGEQKGFDGVCATGIVLPELLLASHIKPWKSSDAKTERTNPRNGLCLNSLHDKAFDRGLITIDKEYRIVNSTKISSTVMDDDTREWFLSYEGKQIILPDRFYPDKAFIEYHNDMIFQGA